VKWWKVGYLEAVRPQQRGLLGLRLGMASLRRRQSRVKVKGVLSEADSHTLKFERIEAEDAGLSSGGGSGEMI
jgi:hypothetical protein